MSAHPQFTPNQNMLLVGQVNGECPLCGFSLLYKKGEINHKGFDLAHIYPLNPTKSEIDLLSKEEKLSEDVNHESNLIPLCKNCHVRFDKPRTVEEYRNLVSIKRAILNRTTERNIWKDHSLKDEINSVVLALSKLSESDISGELQMDPKTIDQKTDGKIPHILKMKIKGNVNYYFPFVRNEFVEIEKFQPGISSIIALQVKLYHDDQKSRGVPESEIFQNIIAWINTQTSGLSIDACEIITSFFVQNCEVFS